MAVAVALLPPGARCPFRGGPDLWHNTLLAREAPPPRERAGHRQGEGGQPGGLTFRVQGLDLQLQRGVLQVELAGGGDDLNAVDEVHDGVATQDLAGGCRRERARSGSRGLTPPSAPHRVGGLTLWQRLGVTNDPKNTGLEEPSHP